MNALADEDQCEYCLARAHEGVCQDQRDWDATVAFVRAHAAANPEFVETLRAKVAARKAAKP